MTSAEDASEQTEILAAVLERLERLERLVGVQAAEAAGLATTAVDPQRHGPAAHASFNAWLRGAKRSGVVMVVGGVAHGDGHLSTSLVRFERGEGTSRDWRAIAAACHALGSEPRLRLLRALEGGPRGAPALGAAGGERAFLLSCLLPGDPRQPAPPAPPLDLDASGAPAVAPAP
jgi:hypothetical protein